MFLRTVCWLRQDQSCGDEGCREVRVMVKSLGFAHPKKTFRARWVTLEETPTMSSSSVCSSNPAMKINPKLNVVDEQCARENS